MMRFMVGLALLFPIIALSRVASFQQQVPNGAKVQVSQNVEPQLTYQIVESKYCSAGGLLLVLQAKYKNTGKDTLILFRYAVAPFEYRISASTEAARARRYEQVISPTMGSSPSLIQFGDQPPGDYFVTLGPGQSYTPPNTVTVPLFVADTDKEDSENYVPPGNHVLQLNVSTWPFPSRREEEIRIRWKRFGTLWTKSVLSNPMAFQIARVHDRSLSDCNAPQD